MKRLAFLSCILLLAGLGGCADPAKDDQGSLGRDLVMPAVF